MTTRQEGNMQRFWAEGQGVGAWGRQIVGEIGKSEINQ